MALDCGVPVDSFWDFTLQELVDIIDSQTRRRKEEIGRLFVLADAISSRVGYFFSDPKKRRPEDILQPWDSYHDLYKNDLAEQEIEAKEEKEIDAELEAYKARMAVGIAAWNARFEEGKK